MYTYLLIYPLVRVFLCISNPYIRYIFKGSTSIGGISVAPWFSTCILLPSQDIKGIYFCPYVDDCLMKSHRRLKLTAHVNFIKQIPADPRLDHQHGNSSVGTNTESAVHWNPTSSESPINPSPERDMYEDTVGSPQSPNETPIISPVAESPGTFNVVREPDTTGKATSSTLTNVPPSLYCHRPSSIDVAPYQMTFDCVFSSG